MVQPSTRSNQILSSSKCIGQKFDIAYLFLFSSLEKEIFQSLTLEHYLQENAITISHALQVTFKLKTKGPLIDRYTYHISVNSCHYNYIYFFEFVD